MSYIYLVGWTTHDRWYVGSRVEAGCTPSELWVEGGYFTSSTPCREFAMIHGKPDVIQILEESDDVQWIRRREQQLIASHNAVADQRYFNQRGGYLTEQDVAEICALRNHGLSPQKIGDIYGVTREAIRKVWIRNNLL